MARQWRVVYSIDPGAEFDALETALKSVRNLPEGSQLRSGRFVEGTGEEAEFSFIVAADNEEDLIPEAEVIFERTMFDAGLKPHPGRLLAYEEVATARWHRARQKAIKRFRAGDLEEAVVFAHIACERCATGCLHGLLAASGLPRNVAERLIRSTALHDKHGRQLFDELAGTTIGETAWWSEYRLHVERRNLVVHRGMAVTRDEARRSIEVCGTFCETVSSALVEHD